MQNFLTPSFLAIGAQKAGTTSFFQYLNSHESFSSPIFKELHFFDQNFDRGINWYQEKFPNINDQNLFTGEATPYYLFHPHAARRAHKYFPNIKLICLLREPASRAFSQYEMNVKRGNEKEAFEDAIALEEKRISSEYKKMLSFEAYNSTAVQLYSYKKRGIYIHQIDQWLKYFPINQFLFIGSRELKNDPNLVMNRFADFMGRPHFDLSYELQLNAGNKILKPNDYLIELKKYYEPYNERLFKLIGINLNE